MDDRGSMIEDCHPPSSILYPRLASRTCLQKGKQINGPIKLSIAATSKRVDIANVVVTATIVACLPIPAGLGDCRRQIS